MSSILVGNISVGGDAPMRINCNIGCNVREQYQEELCKILAIKESGVVPDFMMDLSLVSLETPLYKTIIDELNIPVGTVLSYLPFDKECGLDWECVKQYLLQLSKNGIAFVTIHFTADRDLLDEAKKNRKVPCTSRGGAMVLYDSILNNRTRNLYREHIGEIVSIAQQNDIAISLGTTFRSSNVFEACDSVHLEETRRQMEMCRYLQSKGVKVIVENSGHIGLDKLEEHAQRLQKFDAPIMPLGPIVCDNAVGEDHITAAIGGAFAGYWNAAHILNCVTRNEHSESAITVDVILEAIKTTKIVAHCINLTKGIPDDWNQEQKIDAKRAEEYTCIVGEHCTRCKNVCPLKMV